MAITTGWESVKVADGTSMRMYVVRPEIPAGAKVPGVILLQEAFGVNNHIRGLAQKIGGLGYLTVAPEMFHRTAPGFEAAYDDRDAIMAQLGALTNEGMSADVTAAYDWLKHSGVVNPAKVAALGYCMGGRAAFMANAVVPLAAAVSYYGGGIAPALLPLATKQQGPVLFFWGGRDAHIGTEAQREVADALRQAGKNFVNVEFSDADHGFFCDERKSYHPVAARESWALCTRFMRDNLEG